VSTIDPRIAEIANALADSVEAGLATRAQVLSAMQLAFQGGEIAGSLQTCAEWNASIERVTK